MPENSQPPKNNIKVGRIISRLFLVLVILSALLLLPAGRLDWVSAWVLITAFGLFLLFYALWVRVNDPAQLQERSRVAENVKPWDKRIMGIYTTLLPTVFIIAGLDAGRFRWSVVPVIVQVIAWAGLIFGPAIILWTTMSNTFLSRQARIQDERSQKVISRGPYRFVRHPMYLGILILFSCLGPALGSFFALVPGAAIDILFIIRTAKEDSMLQNELTGYKDYAQQVRYRLIPGLW
jgi:protein-S-isoprenylcysteine O-methyltransferase Ste14